jgi:hypothetical protein
LIATAIFAIPAFALLLLTVLNAGGAVLAHFDSQRYHLAQPCSSKGADPANCVLSEKATVDDIYGGNSFLITLSNGKTTLVEQAKLILTPRASESGSNARLDVWHGKIVQLTYDSEIVESTENPDWYSQTWPVTLAFGLLITAVASAVYVVTSWATGFPVSGLSIWRNRPSAT